MGADTRGELCVDAVASFQHGDDSRAHRCELLGDPREVSRLRAGTQRGEQIHRKRFQADDKAQQRTLRLSCPTGSSTCPSKPADMMIRSGANALSAGSKVDCTTQGRRCKYKTAKIKQELLQQTVTDLNFCAPHSRARVLQLLRRRRQPN